VSAVEAEHHREDVEILWLRQDTADGTLTQHHHCVQCQPHEDVAAVDCSHCADGPLLAGQLAHEMYHVRHGDLPPVLRAWLAERGWRTSRPLACPRHRHGDWCVHG
jgi:hypothetical protein